MSDGRLEVSTTEWVTETPLVEDPYEKRTVMVKTSRMPGADEGLFAARYELFRDTAFHTVAKAPLYTYVKERFHSTVAYNLIFR